MNAVNDQNNELKPQRMNRGMYSISWLNAGFNDLIVTAINVWTKGYIQRSKSVGDVMIWSTRRPTIEPRKKENAQHQYSMHDIMIWLSTRSTIELRNMFNMVFNARCDDLIVTAINHWTSTSTKKYIDKRVHQWTTTSMDDRDNTSNVSTNNQGTHST